MIDSDIFAGYEGGVLEIEHRVDDLRNFTYPTEGMKLRQLRARAFSTRALQGPLLVLMT